jgi:hypothetical protein
MPAHASGGTTVTYDCAIYLQNFRAMPVASGTEMWNRAAGGLRNKQKQSDDHRQFITHHRQKYDS